MRRKSNINHVIMINAMVRGTEISKDKAVRDETSSST